MDARPDMPMICTLPLKRRLTQVSRALADGRTVVLLSKRDTDLRRTLAALDCRVPNGTAVRLGDGRTATLLRADGTQKPYAFWPRPKPAPIWRWSCRACGAVDDRWSWRDVDETTPMARHLVVLGEAELVEVPWACPRGGCHGAPQWHVTEPSAS